jgi:NAD(P)-dependent dehydrogenase (short-subunit alcohol dehydrogenase family)
MSRVISINTIGAALVFKHFMPLLARDRPVWFGALSARVGSIGDNRLGGWMSYRASKSALNQIVRCAAIEQARTNKQSVIAALHPGTVETDLTRNFARGKYTAHPEQAARDLIHVLTELKPTESGGFYAYDGGEIVW